MLEAETVAVRVPEAAASREAASASARAPRGTLWGRGAAKRGEASLSVFSVLLLL